MRGGGGITWEVGIGAYTQKMDKIRSLQHRDLYFLMVCVGEAS